MPSISDYALPGTEGDEADLLDNKYRIFVRFMALHPSVARFPVAAKEDPDSAHHVVRAVASWDSCSSASELSSCQRVQQLTSVRRLHRQEYKACGHPPPTIGRSVLSVPRATAKARIINSASIAMDYATDEAKTVAVGSKSDSV